MIEIDKLVSFMIKANQAGYASDNSRTENFNDGAHQIVFEKDDMKSVDYWWGGNPFSGQESISVAGKVVWAMQYRGWMEESFEDISSETFTFLRHALKLCTKAEPLRGPKMYKEDGFTYVNSWGANLDNFKGEERIWKNDKHVYTCKYFGGWVNIKLDKNKGKA